MTLNSVFYIPLFCTVLTQAALKIPDTNWESPSGFWCFDHYFPLFVSIMTFSSLIPPWVWLEYIILKFLPSAGCSELDLYSSYKFLLSCYYWKNNNSL